MFIEEKKNFQTSQDSKNTFFPETEIEVSKIIKDLNDKDFSIEIVGSGSKKIYWKKTTMCKNIKSFQVKWNSRIFTRRALY